MQIHDHEFHPLGGKKELGAEPLLLRVEKSLLRWFRQLMVWECFWIPQEDLESVVVERNFWNTA